MKNKTSKLTFIEKLAYLLDFFSVSNIIITAIIFASISISLLALRTAGYSKDESESRDQ